MKKEIADATHLPTDKPSHEIRHLIQSRATHLAALADKLREPRVHRIVIELKLLKKGRIDVVMKEALPQNRNRRRLDAWRVGHLSGLGFVRGVDFVQLA
jgi:hypothetical protein